jgi:hypothetical protein
MARKSTRFQDIQNQFDKYEKHRDIFKKINYLYSERKKPEPKSFENAIPTILSPLEIWKYLFSSFDIQSLKTMREQEVDNYSILPFSATKYENEDILFRMDYFLKYMLDIETYTETNKIYKKIIEDNSKSDVNAILDDNVFADTEVKELIQNLLTDAEFLKAADEWKKAILKNKDRFTDKVFPVFPVEATITNKKYTFLCEYKDARNCIIFNDTKQKEIKITFICNNSDFSKSIVIYENINTEEIVIHSITTDSISDESGKYKDTHDKIRICINKIYNINSSAT